jgi:hypothetical protein
MSLPKGARGRALKEVIARIADSPLFWGILGWALLILRYASEVIHPRYGG